MCTTIIKNATYYIYCNDVLFAFSSRYYVCAHRAHFTVQYCIWLIGYQDKIKRHFEQKRNLSCLGRYIYTVFANSNPIAHTASTSFLITSLITSHNHQELCVLIVQISYCIYRHAISPKWPSEVWWYLLIYMLKLKTSIQFGHGFYKYLNGQFPPDHP
jgi:hypothetical protein